MMRYEIITYDVWGNTRDGFEVNQSFSTGRHVEIPDDATDAQINRIVGARGVTWDGEPGYTLYGNSKRNGKPILELRAEYTPNPVKKKNGGAMSGKVRIVHNKLLGGWYVVRGPHQTPISGRFDTRAEAEAWLLRRNPAKRKKPVRKKKVTKKRAAKKPARKKVAVAARSRATGKPPSARLKKRRARNTVAGAYPNPAPRGYVVFGYRDQNPNDVRFYEGGAGMFGERRNAAIFGAKRGAVSQAESIGARSVPGWRFGVAAAKLAPWEVRQKIVGK